MSSPIEKAKGAIGSVKVQPLTPDIVSKLILTGDISKLLPVQKVEYVTKLCERVGIDPMTQPFKLLKLQGREVLYADKGATQQLCQIHNISTEVTKRESLDGVYLVTVRASMGSRFTDEDGVVNIENLRGDALCNAYMKAVTKAKRRAVLALCGLGMLDETEIETIPGAETIQITSIDPAPEEIIKYPVEDIIQNEKAINLPPRSNAMLITDPQRKRLYAISRDAGMSRETFTRWLLSQGYDSSSKITKDDYERVCLEAKAYNPVDAWGEK